MQLLRVQKPQVWPGMTAHRSLPQWHWSLLVQGIWAAVTRHVTDPAEQVEFVIAMGNWLMF